METISPAHITPRELNVMNSGIRKMLMKLYEFPTFKAMLERNQINLQSKVILDAGCGNGNSTRLIAQEFTPVRLDAFDILPEQIALAKKQKVNATFSLGDITQIKQESGLYDAVFIFGILHHVPHWGDAIGEIHRVLKSGGFFLLEEPTPKILEHVEHHHHVKHPKEAQFTDDDMKSTLETTGFRIIELKLKLRSILMFILAQKT